MDLYTSLDGQSSADYRMLYVVPVVWEGDVIRLISARVAEPAERRRYEND